MNSDFGSECVQNFEQLTDELEMLEDQLATKLKIRRQTARRTLLAMSRAGSLHEDDTVERWQEAYSVYTDWLRWDMRNRPPPPRIDETEQGAAEAALAVL
jgi:transcription initiation factor IIE alpha subunit